MKPSTSIAIITAMLACIASFTHANTIDITSDWNGDTITKGGAPWSASCSVAGTEPCMQGLTGPSASWSTTMASGYQNNGNPASELAILNTLLGNTGNDLIVGTTDIIGAGSSFSADYQYFAIKQSNYVMFFENLSGAALDVDFVNEFSHVTGFGGPLSAVPLPAAAWLFGSALLALAGVKRRKATR